MIIFAPPQGITATPFVLDDVVFIPDGQYRIETAVRCERTLWRHPVRRRWDLARAQGSVKVGISARPENRLKNLQAANPNQQLSLEWTATGTAIVIRKAERGAHARLAARRIRNEWFWVKPAIAIQAIINAVNNGDGFR